MPKQPPVIPPDIAARIRGYLETAMKYARRLEMGTESIHDQAELLHALTTAKDIIIYNITKDDDQ